MKKIISTIIALAGLIGSVILFSIMHKRREEFDNTNYQFMVGFVIVVFVASLFILIITFSKTKKIDIPEPQVKPKERLGDFMERWGNHTRNLN